MIRHEKQAVIAKVKELWPNLSKISALDNPNVEVAYTGKTGASITLSSMYKPPGVTFAQLQALAQFFDTLNIETESEFARGGCDTCDYGSEYGFTIYVREGDPFREIKP